MTCFRFIYRLQFIYKYLLKTPSVRWISLNCFFYISSCPIKFQNFRDNCSLLKKASPNILSYCYSYCFYFFLVHFVGTKRQIFSPIAKEKVSTQVGILLGRFFRQFRNKISTCQLVMWMTINKTSTPCRQLCVETAWKLIYYPKCGNVGEVSQFNQKANEDNKKRRHSLYEWDPPATQRTACQSFNCSSGLIGLQFELGAFQPGSMYLVVHTRVHI